MSNKDQEKLELVVNKMIASYGTQKTIEIIKQNHKNPLFESRQHYPNGVWIDCNSEKGGLMLGKRG